MKQKTTIIFLSIILTTLGSCNEKEKHDTEDLEGYVVKKMESISGRTFDAKSPKKLKDLEWEGKDDAGGVKIVVKGDHFDAVDKMFTRLLGKPHSRSENQLALPKVTYHARQHGFAVTYEVRDDVPKYQKSVFILILKPLE